MKKIILSIFICISLFFSGCENKSSEEVMDIEQFKCQDSIQTVFDVLGETEIQTEGIEREHYTYEDLNLYGYDGKLCFNVRNDKDTIRRFYFIFELNDKEFEDLLSKLEEKYGDYEKREYSYGRTFYNWEILEEDKGYDSVSFGKYGRDKEYGLIFSDEWTQVEDEEYYENFDK